MFTRRHLLASLPLFTAAPSARAGEASLTVPIVVTRQRRIMTSLSISDQGPFYFIVDSGAFVSALRPSIIRKLGLRRVDSMRVGGLGGSDYAQVYDARKVVFGESFRVDAMAMAGLEFLEKADADGLLAAGFLTAAEAALDFDKLRIDFHPGGKGLNLDGYTAWPTRRELDGAGEKIFIDVTVDGLRANCLLDTGAQPAVILGSDFVKKHKLWDRYADPQEGKRRGVHGDEVRSRFVHANTLEVGNLPVKGGPLTLLTPTANDHLGVGCDGIIGMGAIGRFNLIFKKDSLYAKPNRYFEEVAPLFSA
ncbi:pepsin/retropepsin-like aspartic protease family protein [Asticcacaulis sp. W401b]|uniref:pepsin/retropepsin-like aspartic protease family protein n=1 Tax=Asticcacaulis sp. W401b TaxID=3388666 RepID=UPI00397087A7